ncbi:MAG: hypothetical protein GF401_18705 [Chitinivibrionales bacterium]|nr:hypothetical protein [Chitinivibrionales bacterium]
MELIRSLENFSCSASVAAVGNFDGIHRGHGIIIDEVVMRARKNNAASILVTFEPHTRAVLNPDGEQPILTTLEEKCVLVESREIDYLVSLSFDSSLQHMTYSEFIDKILSRKLGLKELVMGEGHMFGKDKKDSNSLHQSRGRMHFSTFIVPTAVLEGSMISSTEIRRKIIGGRLSEAVYLLGHPYLILTKRIGGIQQGRKQGYPTLNFAGVTPPKVTPHTGVYAGKVHYKNATWTGAVYYGTCPTFATRKEHFEFHSFDAITGEPPVGETARLWLYDFIRPDHAFATGGRLTEQISKDVSTIKEFFLREK